MTTEPSTLPHSRDDSVGGSRTDAGAARRIDGRRLLWAAGVTCAVLAVVSIVPGFDVHQTPHPSASQATAKLSLPASTAQPKQRETSKGPRWQTVVVQAGQTMGGIFSSLNLPSTVLHRLLQHPEAKDSLTRIRVGSRFDFDIAEDGAFRALRFERGDAERVVLRIEDDEIVEHKQQRALEHRVMMASGVIENSLYNAGEAAGMSVGAILEMAKVFGYDIDFAQDLRVGDRFDVVYEEVWRDGARLRDGDVLAATFINQGKRFEVYRYVFADGRTEYYDQDGRPTKKSFLRMPIEFARISSRFSSARKHPVLGKVRAHRGVDYAANTGTPIHAAGEGKIQYAGWKNGYGRTIIIQHAGNVTTLYGHMSRLGGYKTGARVRQGDVIGYVGQSGLASGPHLHYEFRVAGVHRDPLKVTLPKPQPLPRNELARFQSQRAPLQAQLSRLAAAEPTTPTRG